MIFSIHWKSWSLLLVSEKSSFGKYSLPTSRCSSASVTKYGVALARATQTCSR